MRKQMFAEMEEKLFKDSKPEDSSFYCHSKMPQDRTYVASIEQDGDRRAKRLCKTTSRRIVRTLYITMVISIGMFCLY